MCQDRSRSPASFSDSDEDDEPESFSDYEEEDEPESFSDSEEEDESLTLPIAAEVVDIEKGEPLALQIWLREEEEGLHVRAEAVCGTRKDLLYTNEGFPDGDEHYRKGVTTSTKAHGAFTGCGKSEETAELKQKASFCEVCQWRLDQIVHQNQQTHNSMMEYLNLLASVFEKNQEMQRSMMQMIQQTQQLVMMKLLPPQQQPMQQQQPLQPAAATADQQPQPQLGRTEEDEG